MGGGGRSTEREIRGTEKRQKEEEEGTFPIPFHSKARELHAWNLKIFTCFMYMWIRVCGCENITVYNTVVFYSKINQRTCLLFT